MNKKTHLPLRVAALWFSWRVVIGVYGGGQATFSKLEEKATAPPFIFPVTGLTEEKGSLPNTFVATSFDKRPQGVYFTLFDCIS
jgi:hypothetical protein